MKHSTKQRRTTIKRGLNKLLRPRFNEEFVFWNENYAIIATRITVLASMMTLFYINKAMDADGEFADNFFDLDGKTFFKDCFHNVLAENTRTLPREFQNIVREVAPRMKWPTRQGMGNVFNALIDMYVTNAKTNIKMHTKQHLKKFLRIKQYELNNQMRRNGATDNELITAADVDGAVNAIFYQKRFDRFNAIKRYNNEYWCTHRSEMLCTDNKRVVQINPMASSNST